MLLASWAKYFIFFTIMNSRGKAMTPSNILRQRALQQCGVNFASVNFAL